MHSIHTRQRKYQEKVRIELIRFINTYGTQHCLAGTLTFKGSNHRLNDLNNRWKRFISRISPHVLAYYALVDFNHTNPHFHYVLAVPENIQEGIDLEQLLAFQNSHRERRATDLFPNEEGLRLTLRHSIGSNASLSSYRAKVKAACQHSGAGYIMDLWPIYKAPEAIAGYYAKAYGNSNRAKRTDLDARRQKLIFTPRSLPRDIRIRLDEFSLISPGRRRYHCLVGRLCGALGLEPQDLNGLAHALRLNVRQIHFAITGFLSRIPGDPARWPLETIHSQLNEFYGVPYHAMPGARDPELPADLMAYTGRLGTARGIPGEPQTTAGADERFGMGKTKQGGGKVAILQPVPKQQTPGAAREPITVPLVPRDNEKTQSKENKTNEYETYKEIQSAGPGALGVLQEVQQRNRPPGRTGPGEIPAPEAQDRIEAVAGDHTTRSQATRRECFATYNSTPAAAEHPATAPAVAGQEDGDQWNQAHGSASGQKSESQRPGYQSRLNPAREGSPFPMPMDRPPRPPGRHGPEGSTPLPQHPYSRGERNPLRAITDENSGWTSAPPARGSIHNPAVEGSILEFLLVGISDLEDEDSELGIPITEAYSARHRERVSDCLPW